jgi:hypothetical protein
MAKKLTTVARHGHSTSNYIMQISRASMYVDRCSDEFIKGMRSFLIMAEENTWNGFMCCPCGVCQNEKDYPSSRILHTHLFRSGLMSDYNC